MNKENQAKVNPSYDTTLSPDKRLADFLGKYFVGLNGATAPNDRHKQEIVDYVSEHILPDVRKRAWSLMASRIDSHGFMLLMNGDYELKEKISKECEACKDETKIGHTCV